MYVVDNKHNIPLSAFIGPAGMPGKCFSSLQNFFKRLVKDKLHIWRGRNIHM